MTQRDRGPWVNPGNTNASGGYQFPALVEGVRLGDIVFRGGVFFQSQTDNNVTVPGIGTSWKVVPGVITVTAAATALSGGTLLANAAAGAFTVTLPPVISGRWCGIKKIDTSANAVTVVPASGTIDNAASYVLSGPMQSIIAVCDGTNWWVV